MVGQTRNTGFSLLEMSVVLIILSLLTGMGLSVATARIENTKFDLTNRNLDIIEKTLLQFTKATGRLPCPANGTLTLTDVNFGIEAGNIGACTGGTPAANRLSGEAVTGVVPTKTLQLPDAIMLDGWGNRITYAVDRRMTAPAALTTYPITNTSVGDIQVVDANGNARTPVAPNGAIVVLLSHGRNGHGAYLKVGGATLFDGSSANANELENCDCTAGAAIGTFDRVFVQQQRTETTAADNKFDDILRYKMRFHFRNAIKPEETVSSDEGYDGPDLVVGYDTDTPYNIVYKMNYTTGLLSKLANLSPAPVADVDQVVWSPDNNQLAVVGNAINFSIYKRAGLTFTKITSGPNNNGTDTLPGSIVRSAAFSPNGAYLAIGLNANPYAFIYRRSGDSFTKITGNGASNNGIDIIPSGPTDGIAWSPDSTYVAFTHANPNYVSIYQRSGDTFNKVTPTGNPSGNGDKVAFSPNGKYLAVAHAVAPYVTVYNHSGSTFTKLTAAGGEFTAVADRPSGNANIVSFSHDGRYMVVGFNGGVRMLVYKVDSVADTFTKIAGVPAAAITSDVRSASFNADDSYLAITTMGAPYVILYRHVGDTFTRIMPDPVDLPTAAADWAAFNN